MIPIAMALVGLGITAYGAIKRAETQKKANANKMPGYEIPQEEFDNLRQAEMLASQGISPQSKALYQQMSDRGLTSTTNAILKGGGDANSIGNAFERYGNSAQEVALYDDKLRMQHLNDLMNARTRMSAARDKDYQINKFAPWANKAQALSQQLAADTNTMNSGLNMFGSSLGSIGSYFGGNRGANMSGQGAQGNAMPSGNSGNTPMSGSSGAGMGMYDSSNMPESSPMVTDRNPAPNAAYVPYYGGNDSTSGYFGKTSSPLEYRGSIFNVNY